MSDLRDSKRATLRAFRHWLEDCAPLVIPDELRALAEQAKQFPSTSKPYDRIIEKMEFLVEVYRYGSKMKEWPDDFVVGAAEALGWEITDARVYTTA